MQKKDNIDKILIIIGIIIPIWLGIIIAPISNGGLPNIIKEFDNVISNPFHFEFCSNTLKCVLLFLCVYGISIGMYYSTKRNYRRREEHGSAKWGDQLHVNKKYMQNPPTSNKILTQAVSIGYNAKKHRRNLNTLVIGGSGAGKTRFFAKPNVMQANTSFVILDPKGGATCCNLKRIA